MMSQIKTYYTTIQLVIFRTAVLVLVSHSRADILEDLPKIYKELDIKKKDAISDIRMIKEAFNDDVDDFMPPGYTIRLANPAGDVIMMFKAKNVADVTEEDIVHETHHASKYILEYRGIQDEECEAYVQEYMFNQMMCRIDEWNDSHPKRKKKPA